MACAGDGPLSGTDLASSREEVFGDDSGFDDPALGGVRSVSAPDSSDDALADVARKLRHCRLNVANCVLDPGTDRFACPLTCLSPRPVGGNSCSAHGVSCFEH